ncbi:MAG: site-specific integrase [Thermodesulfovibrionales bacterium]
MIRDVKFKSPDASKYIKTMHPLKGPLLRSEQEALRHRLKEWLLRWEDGNLNSVDKTIALGYALNDETTRRFEELCKLNENDIYKTPEGVFVRFGKRKAKSEGSDSHKAHHAISDWLFSYFESYIKETAEIRKELNTKKLFVWESNIVENLINPGGKMIVTGSMMSKALKRLLKQRPVPNRRFFASSEHDLSELRKNKDLCLHFTSSRGRDTFGTHMTLLGVDKALIATRMGHKSMKSQRRYSSVTHPDFASDKLSQYSGEFYRTQADYFMNPPVSIVSPEEAVRDLEAPDGAVFGGCKKRCGCNPVLGCYPCGRYFPMIPSPEHARNLSKIDKEQRDYEQLIVANGGIVDKRLEYDLEKARAICAYCVRLSAEYEEK